MPKRGVTKFQSAWTNEFPWVRPVDKDPYQAYCELCRKSITVDSMGRQAVVSHSASKKHQEAVRDTSSKATPLETFFKPGIVSPRRAASNASLAPKESSEFTDRSSTVASSSGNHTTASLPVRPPPTLKERVMGQYLMKDQTTRREIIWCMGAVVNHDSLRSSEEKVTLFKHMFSDIEEVQQMELSKSKISYVITYGLGPHFKRNLDDITKPCENYVFGFDESLNKIAQKQQMDVIIRFWNEEKNEVNTRYLTSVFLGHTTAEDLLRAFKQAIDGYDLKKVLQVSMDGPNVNFKFLRLFKEAIKSEDTALELFDIGSCGIHTLHCAFKAGMRGTGWEIIDFLRALYNLFKDVPSRRGDYTEITDKAQFPLKFCAVRWLENAKVAARAQAILRHMKAYLKGIKAKKTVPKCKSFEIIDRIMKDKLLPAKLAFFHSIAEEIEPFLREYQTDSPMAAFLFNSLTVLLNDILERLVKPEVIKTTPVTKIDLTKKENLQRVQDFHLGYATRDALRQCSIKDIEMLQFRKECMTCLKLFAEKILERSPLKYRLTKALSYLDPTVISSADGAITPLKSALEFLVKSNRLTGHVAEKVEKEFKTLSEKEVLKDMLKTYDRTEERLDHFWMRMLKDNNYGNDNLKAFVKTLLILSHGNASLERGFSINKECLIENLREQSLVAQRQVYDAVSAAGGTLNVPITTALVHSARNAHARYAEALKQRATEDKAQRNQVEQKKRVIQERKELSAKKLKVLQEIDKKKAELEEIDNKVKSLHQP